MKRIGNSKEPTRKQIENMLSNLHEKFPHKSFCIQIENWFHRISKNVKINYSLSIIPGFKGHQCSKYTENSWLEFLDTYREIIKNG